MPLLFLEAHNVRLFEHFACQPHPHLNLIFGPNASGKSSFLEAIGFLSLGRSFRTGQITHVIRYGTEQLSVFGRYTEAGEGVRSLGLQRGPGWRKIRVDEETQTTAALARLLPLLVIAPETHRTFLQDADERRHSLDWGLFHVEPNFLEHWRRYQRALKQRNAALRAGQEFRVWDHDLAAAGEVLTQARAAYLAAWEPRFHGYSERLLDQPPPTLTYRPGWAAGTGLREALAAGAARDRESGYTHAGPHRADIALDFGGHLARYSASHGQQKLLILALKLAQLAVLQEQAGRAGVLLIDDLPADLDREHRARALAALDTLPTQAFVSATEPDLLSVSAEHRAFHVEQGRLSEPVQQ